MPQLKNRASFPSVLRALCATVIVLVQTHSGGGQPQVIGSQTIVAVLGDDVILPCHLVPVVDAVSMTLEWARPDLTPRFVFVWHNGQELLINKNPSYEGRTSASINELKHGNISLRLSNVQLSDEGKYRCLVPKLDTQTNIELVVGAASSPVISLSGIDLNSHAVMLECESAGWYPEPEVLWLDAEGNIVSAGPTETLRGPDGLYTVSSSVTVDNKHSNTFTCKLQHNKTNQTRETQIQVQDDFFVVSCRPVGHIAIVLIVGFLFILTVCFVVWKCRQNKNKTKMHHGEKPEQREREKEQLIGEREKNKDLQLANVTKELQAMTVRTESEEKEMVATLTEQKQELENLKEHLKNHMTEMQTLFDDNKTKVQKVDKKINENEGDKTANKAQGYLDLKGILIESNQKLQDNLIEQQNLHLKTEKLMHRTEGLIKEIRDRKGELEAIKE